MSEYKINEKLTGKQGKRILKGYTEGMKVCTRFAPEPSGFLHLGHIKAAMLSQYYARSTGGTLLLRFDDTNPIKENDNFVDNITADLKKIGFIPDKTTYTSDYFDLLLEYAEKMIKMGKAYIDDISKEEMKEGRMNGIESPNRNNSVEKNLEMWEEMKNGTEHGKKCVMRAKIDMKCLNKVMRDPTMYRCVDTPHHRTGSKYKVYPLYDFCVGIIDSIEGVTHALRSAEYSDRAVLYDWVIDTFGLRKPVIEVFSRLNFAYVLLSKRHLNTFVTKGIVEDWNDPRFPTVQGTQRRGLTLEAMREFCLSQGSSKNLNLMDMEKVWVINKKIIDPIVPRYTAVDKENVRRITLDMGDVAEKEAEIPLHKKNASLGKKMVKFHKTILMDNADVITIADNEEVTLIDWGNCIFTNVKENKAKLHLEGDFKTTKKKLTWVADEDLVELELRDYDYLITCKKLEEGMNLDDYINPRSLEISYALGETAMKNLKVGDSIQLQRKGYFKVDAIDGNKMILVKIPDGSAKGPKVIKDIERKSKKQLQKEAAEAKKKAAAEAEKK